MDAANVAAYQQSCTSKGEDFLINCEADAGGPVGQLGKEVHNLGRLLVQHHRQLQSDLPLPIPLQCKSPY